MEDAEQSATLGHVASPVVDDVESYGIGLSVAAVARRLGVSPSTLRTWDRRYGLGPTDHRDGAHRRYTPLDVSRLMHMQRLVRSGVRVADAAEAARDWHPAAMSGPGDPAIAAGSPLEFAPAGDMPSAPTLVRGLSAAAGALDSRACSSLIRRSLDDRGVVWTWEELLRPVLISVGRVWARTGGAVEVEHLLSHVITMELLSLVDRQSPRSTRPVLLACAPEEMHCLPLFAVAAGLAERGVEARVLGASTPWDSLAAAVRRLGPSSVLLWAYVPVSEETRSWQFPRLRPTSDDLCAGPGWGDHVPPGATAVTDLASAITRLVRMA